MRTFVILTAALVWAFPVLAQSPDSDPIPFRGRHLIAFNVGMLTDVTSSASVDVTGGVSVNADGSGLLASGRYAYWFREDFALDFAVGVVEAEASVDVDGTRVTKQDAMITRVLVGVRYQPLETAVARNVRPYVVGSIGPYAGNASDVTVDVAAVEIGSHTDTVVGGRVGLGLDLILRSWIALGLEAGYGFAGDFDRPIGGETNYSSPDFLVSLGVSLGGSR
jgi:hypothetical protein